MYIRYCWLVDQEHGSGRCQENSIEDIRAASPGSAGRNRTLGLKKLENIVVPLPEFDEQKHFSEIARHMEEIDIRADGKIICEPCGRNTAPAILLGMLYILKHEEDAILCIFPADHVIRNISVFHEKLRSAIKLAEMGYIVTFGIKPHYPETGYC